MYPISNVTPALGSKFVGTGLVVSTGALGERKFLFVGNCSTRRAIMLHDSSFAVFEPNERDEITGSFIGSIDFEVDLSSAVDLTHQYTSYGSLIRAEKRLMIAARAWGANGMGHLEEVLLRDDLAEGNEGLRLAYRKWRLVLRSGDDVATLMEFDVPESVGPPR